MVVNIIEQAIRNIKIEILDILLTDKTTKKYIRWCTDNYISLGLEYRAEQEMHPDLINRYNMTIIQPRKEKSKEEKVSRTRNNAEVFTPAWVCNEQNNLVDTAWFGRSDVFNVQLKQGWETRTDHIVFPNDKTWKDYVDARRLEICCGEGPYLVSRYDTVSGQLIPLKDRIGLLDRKIRIINENTEDIEEWLKWTVRAFQSCYGYDYQGDNVFLARLNLLYSFIEYMDNRMNRFPTLIEMKKIANIISWNIWQMNGVTMTAPYSTAEPVYKQMTIFDFIETDQDENNNMNEIDELPCRIFDWRSNESIEFRSMIKEG